MDENEKVVTGKSEESFKVFLRFHPRASTCALLRLDGVHHCYVYTSYTKYAPHHPLLVESLSFECGKLTNNFTNPTLSADKKLRDCWAWELSPASNFLVYWDFMSDRIFSLNFFPTAQKSIKNSIYCSFWFLVGVRSTHFSISCIFPQQ